MTTLQHVVEPHASLTAPRLSAPPEDRHEVHWFTDVVDEIRSYLELVPNWDSYGGGPVRIEIVDAAVEIAGLMAFLGFSRPHVCPESSGGVLLEWVHYDRALVVDLDGNEGNDVYRGVDPALGDERLRAP